MSLSQRGYSAQVPALSYGKAFGEARARLWSESDPDGNILISIAENKLTADLLQEKLTAVMRDAPEWTLYYPEHYKGYPDARKAMAHLMRRTFMQDVDVDPEHIAILAGAGAVLAQLFWCLCERGQGVMLPTPIYPAFLNDMQVQAEAHPVLFELLEERDIATQLTSAAAAAAAEGHPVRVMLLANPNNPMGIVYKRSTVKDIMMWCLDNNCHFVSDEIYANSVWGDSSAAGFVEFVSAEVVARQELAEGNLTPTQVERLPQLLHIVYGLSKDFCASGLRVGVLHTRNAALMAAVTNLSYFQCCSTPTLWALSKVLTDDEFMDRFIAENKKRMATAYKGLEDALVAAGIPHVRATAAMFCWIDLRKGLKGSGWEAERDLLQALIQAGVLVTPGEACKAAEPGFFRMCWAWAPAAALPVAVQRIKKVLDAGTAATS